MMKVIKKLGKEKRNALGDVDTYAYADADAVGEVSHRGWL